MGGEDGLYRLKVPRGVPVDVEGFGGMELEVNQVAMILYGKLKRGELPIERLATSVMSRK